MKNSQRIPPIKRIQDDKQREKAQNHSPPLASKKPFKIQNAVTHKVTGLTERNFQQANTSLSPPAKLRAIYLPFEFKRQASNNIRDKQISEKFNCQKRENELTAKARTIKINSDRSIRIKKISPKFNNNQSDLLNDTQSSFDNQSNIDDYQVWDQGELKIHDLWPEDLNQLSKTQKILKLFKIRYEHYPLIPEQISNGNVVFSVKQLAQQNHRLYYKYFKNQKANEFIDQNNYSELPRISSLETYKRFKENFIKQRLLQQARCVKQNQKKFTVAEAGI